MEKKRKLTKTKITHLLYILMALLITNLREEEKNHYLL